MMKASRHKIGHLHKIYHLLARRARLVVIRCGVRNALSSVFFVITAFMTQTQAAMPAPLTSTPSSLSQSEKKQEEVKRIRRTAPVAPPRSIDSPNGATSVAPAATMTPAKSSTPPEMPPPRRASPAPTRAVIAPRAAVTTKSSLPPRAPLPPAEVVTVIHRLSGWKLLAWFASRRSPVIEVDDLPLDADVHINIIAGFVAGDGRAVVAHLGQGEAEAENLAAPPNLVMEPVDATGRPNLLVVRRDGRQFKARFIGLDAGTGLSLLEVQSPIIQTSLPAAPHAPINTGQRVRLFAPTPVVPTPLAPTPVAPPNAPSNAAVIASVAAATATATTVGNTIFFDMSEVEGQLTAVKHSLAGHAVRAGVRADGLTPSWTGAVVTDVSGALVGIVGRGAAGDVSLIPGDAVRGAMARLLARRASVSQPWFGARGDSVATADPEQLLLRGWSQEQARSLKHKPRGVLLTAVAPGTPASLAGLRSGDVIARVSEHELSGVDDFTFLLKDAGAGSTLDLTVLRALVTEPLKLSVTLGESENPIFATEHAEAESVRSLQAILRAREQSLRQTETELITLVEKAQLEADAARRHKDQSRSAASSRQLLDARKKLDDTRRGLLDTTRRMAEAANKTALAEKRVADSSLASGVRVFNKPQLVDGLQAVAISSRMAARFKAAKGLLVIGVRKGSAASASGLRSGDVIETINGQPFSDFVIQLNQNHAIDKHADLDLGLVREGRKISLNLSPRGANK
ncbi:MAG: PDZ domain-containing protein [Pyrinomonadaceae bacterium]|nr:PDZ domain-containing protein [Pyrinomonadaceae bacterium]